MIQVEQLSFGFTAKDLYKDISFTLEAGQHCALIGSNGTGKSTLAEILIHPEEYLYDGKIVQDESCRSAMPASSAWEISFRIVPCLNFSVSGSRRCKRRSRPYVLL